MSKVKEPTQRVIFRKWNTAHGGDIIAVFPDQFDAWRGDFGMYEHIGQHGDGDYYGILNITTPAQPDEYRELLAELKGIGYKLKVVKKLNRKEAQ